MVDGMSPHYRKDNELWVAEFERMQEGYGLCKYCGKSRSEHRVINHWCPRFVP